MKTALNATVALTLFALFLAGNASAQSEAGPTAPAPESATQPPPPPGIIVTPPRSPSTDTQQSCPDTGHKLELVV
jgi:hypothetical protein